LNIVEEYQGLYMEKRLEVQTSVPEEPIRVRIDEHRCSQVISNLISNAVNFSASGGKIEVSLQQLKGPAKDWTKQVRDRFKFNSNGLCAVLVSDQGPGVADKDKDKIFEKFYSVKPGKRIRGQGTGLGLAISRRIAEAHGGYLWVQDCRDGGSTFFFVLPSLNKA
jgi:two-component system sensor histidine kinase VicK